MLLRVLRLVCTTESIGGQIFGQHFLAALYAKVSVSTVATCTARYSIVATDQRDDLGGILQFRFGFAATSER